MTRKEAISILILCDKKPNWKYTEGMIKTAQEVAAAIVIGQKQPAKLDRGRWDGCDTCKNPIFATCCSGLLNEPVNYCPICGRPLTEEACAELEAQDRSNDPLTLEELQEMAWSQSPVWCSDTDGLHAGLMCIRDDWCAPGRTPHIWLLDEEGNSGVYSVKTLLKAGAVFYRRKPEEE